MTSSCNVFVHIYKIGHSESMWTVNPAGRGKLFVVFPRDLFLGLCLLLYSKHRRSQRFVGTQPPLNADDNQIYSSCLSGECTVLKDNILDCIDAIGKCMESNQLMLNPTKSEFMWCTTPKWVHLINRSAFHLKDGTVEISSIVRNLWVFFNVHGRLCQQTHQDMFLPATLIRVHLTFSANIDGNRVNQLICDLSSWLLQQACLNTIWTIFSICFACHWLETYMHYS